MYVYTLYSVVWNKTLIYLIFLTVKQLISKFIVIGLIIQMKHVESIIKKELFRGDKNRSYVMDKVSLFFEWGFNPQLNCPYCDLDGAEVQSSNVTIYFVIYRENT